MLKFGLWYDIYIKEMKPNINEKYKGYRNQRGGFIEFIVAVVIAIVMLRLLGINLTGILSKPAVQEFAYFVKDLLILVWNDLLLVAEFIRGIAGNGGPVV